VGGTGDGEAVGGTGDGEAVGGTGDGVAAGSASDGVAVGGAGDGGSVVGTGDGVAVVGTGDDVTVDGVGDGVAVGGTGVATGADAGFAGPDVSTGDVAGRGVAVAVSVGVDVGLKAGTLVVVGVGTIAGAQAIARRAKSRTMTTSAIGSPLGTGHLPLRVWNYSTALARRWLGGPHLNISQDMRQSTAVVVMKTAAVYNANIVIVLQTWRRRGGASSEQPLAR